MLESVVNDAAEGVPQDRPDSQAAAEHHDLQSATTSIDDTDLLHKDHAVRMQDAEGGRPLRGLGWLPGNQGCEFIDAADDHRGIVLLTDGVPQRIDYRVDIRPTKGPRVSVDVVGRFVSSSNGTLVRDGTWAAWDKERSLCVMSMYRMGRLVESNLFVEGVKRRSMSLDDDLMRESAGLAHLHVLEAMNMASDATQRAFTQIKREERLATQSHLRQQERLSRQQVQETRRASAVDEQLHAIAYREAARTTANWGSREIFPCVPSRGAFFFTPVNLIGSSRESTIPQAEASSSSSHRAVIRHH